MQGTGTPCRQVEKASSWADTGKTGRPRQAGGQGPPVIEVTPKAADRPGTSLASTCSRASEKGIKPSSASFSVLSGMPARDVKGVLRG